MRDTLASARYLKHYIEPNLPQAPQVSSPWRHVLVIPAYGESADFLHNLSALAKGSERTLVIVVLNHPEAEPDASCNEAFRKKYDSGVVSKIAAGIDLYTLDMDELRGPLPSDKGVGLARKAGCDLAFKWMQAGAIASDWICSTDADATLPADYFSRLAQTSSESAACVFPFVHVAQSDSAAAAATALYELRLHHYVLGLEFAASPYAFHTIGSCLAVRANAYAHVRGFPKRSGGEDFYLLSKVAKLGGVEKLTGNCIHLAARRSERAPFGTGPAVAALLAGTPLEQARVFYHPDTFTALRVVLKVIASGNVESLEDIKAALLQSSLQTPLADSAVTALDSLGITEGLAHCHRQTKSTAQFKRHFNIWMDGFRTLKFIHHVRDNSAESLTLGELQDASPQLWPTDVSGTTDTAKILSGIHNLWRWVT